MFSMMQTFSAALLLCLTLNGLVTAKECPRRFKKITTNHTMCLEDNPNARKLRLSQTDKYDIFNLHNQIRSGVSPTATNMEKMKWDSKLAKLAQKWAMQCTLNHEDDPIKRKFPGYFGNTGQNTAGQSEANATEAVMSWYAKSSSWSYGSFDDPSAIQYAQLIQNDAARVGCGVAECTGTEYKYYYVCNYYSQAEVGPTPYTSGPSCEACPNTCENNLCDCSDMGTCASGYRIDPGVCMCV